MRPRPSRATAPARCRRPRCGARQRSPRATAATPLAIGRRAWALWPGLGVAVLPSIATPAASMPPLTCVWVSFGDLGVNCAASPGTFTQIARKVDASTRRCTSYGAAGSASSNTTCPDSERPTGSPTSTTTIRARASASVRHGFATANETCWGSPSRFALPRNAAAAEQQTRELITQSPVAVHARAIRAPALGRQAAPRRETSDAVAADEEHPRPQIPSLRAPPFSPGACIGTASALRPSRAAFPVTPSAFAIAWKEHRQHDRSRARRAVLRTAAYASERKRGGVLSVLFGRGCA
jgi:hypothetical protein